MPFSDNSYQINWKRLTRWLIPLRRRFPKFLALLYALTSSVNETNSRFLQYRSWVKYRLGITPQAVYLEKLLNDRFDPDERRIDIVRAQQKPAVILYVKDERKPLILGRKPGRLSELLSPVKFYTKAETMQFTVDFIVKVPLSVPFDINELTAYLDIDVLPSKTYKVQIV